MLLGEKGLGILGMISREISIAMGGADRWREKCKAIYGLVVMG